MDGTRCNKGQMRELTVISVCFIAALIGAAFIPAKMITGMGMQNARHVESPAIEYQYTASLSDQFTRTHDVQERKQLLIEILLPLALHSNEKVARQRLVVEQLKQKLPYLSPDDIDALNALARMYLVEAPSHEKMIQELLLRVNVLPVSLVLAQAAIESGWGTSRFSIEGNNIFGLRTDSGFGMVPRARGGGERFAVSVFEDLQSCIDYYIWTINTNPHYAELRYIRSQGRYPYDSYSLAQGLENYSELGQDYVRKVEQLISYNALKGYDEYRLEHPDYGNADKG